MLMMFPSLISLLLFIYTGNSFFISLCLLFLALLLFTACFFRDPKRDIAEGIVCPADGKVVKVTPRSFDVFMSVTNVHVNRSPVSGRVISITHYPGKHSPAYSDEAVKNERLELVLESSQGVVRIIQIAGIFARRIVPYVSKGDKIKKGQRIGMIRFGSRVRVELPSSASIVVNEGDIVRAGETKVGVWS